MDKPFKPFKARKLTHLERAHLNETVIVWLSGQSADMLALIRETYAAYLQCPVCEVNETPMTNEELEFVYHQFETDMQETFRIGGKTIRFEGST